MRGSSLPRLKHLGLDFKDVTVIPMLLESPLAVQLERLTLSVSLGRAFHALPASRRDRVRTVDIVQNVDKHMSASPHD